MTEWMCSWCKKKYTADEFMKLGNKFIDTTNHNLGKVMICECGKAFHIDKWRLQEKQGDKMVSTVCLELEHPGGMWYETMVFKKKGKRWYGDSIDSERYRTQEEAEKGHKKYVALYLKKKTIMDKLNQILFVLFGLILIPIAIFVFIWIYSRVLFFTIISILLLFGIVEFIRNKWGKWKQ